MTRTIRTTNFGENFLRHEVFVQSDPCEGQGQAGFAALATMLQTLGFQPDMLRHVAACPESLRVFHDNGCWTLVATCIVPRPFEAIEG